MPGQPSADSCTKTSTGYARWVPSLLNLASLRSRTELRTDFPFSAVERIDGTRRWIHGKARDERAARPIRRSLGVCLVQFHENVPADFRIELRIQFRGLAIEFPGPTGASPNLS